MNDTPTRTPVRVMVTAENNPTAFAAIQALDAHPAEFKRQCEEIKTRATAELSVLRDQFQAKHKAAWDTIEQALGLDKDNNHSVCTQHLEHHGVAFVRDADEDDSDDAAGDGLPAGLGRLIARALGGDVAAEDDNGVVIEVPHNQ